MENWDPSPSCLSRPAESSTGEGKNTGGGPPHGWGPLAVTEHQRCGLRQITPGLFLIQNARSWGLIVSHTFTSDPVSDPPAWADFCLIVIAFPRRFSAVLLSSLGFLLPVQACAVAGGREELGLEPEVLGSQPSTTASNHRHQIAVSWWGDNARLLTGLFSGT